MTIMRRYGWRPSLPDARDRKFKAPAHIVCALPPSIDLDAPSVGAPFDPAWDQGALGSCGPNTIAENIVWDLLKAKVSYIVTPSRLFLYYNTRALMGTINSDSGVDNRTMLKALAQYGWCDESLWPYDINNYTQQPSQACYDQGKGRTAQIKYEAVNQDLATMKACLVVTGRPFIFGFTVYDSMETPQVDQTGDVPMPTNRDRVVGGHDVLIVGYDDASQRFKFKNHWTPRWGNKGYGTIPYQYAISPNLAGDFWTVTSVNGGVMPDPNPTPTPGPTVGPIQQQVDAVFENLKKVITNPLFLFLLNIVQGFVDQFLSSHNLLSTAPAAVSISALQTIIDTVFAGIEAALSGNPILLFGVKAIQMLVDRYLVSHNLVEIQQGTCQPDFLFKKAG